MYSTRQTVKNYTNEQTHCYFCTFNYFSLVMTKTRTYLIAAFCVLFGSAHSCSVEGRWGENCANICSPGCQNGLCDGDSGICAKPGCLPGWSGLQCNIAECEQSTCQDLGGHCIAPDVCQCPAEEANIVASVQEDANNVNGYGVIVTCDNLKRSGMKGAGIAFAVLTASLIMCGTADKMINKGEYKFARQN